MVSDKGGWCYWRCGGRAPLNYLLERDMLRHRFPFLAGEDTPQTTLSHPLNLFESKAPKHLRAAVPAEVQFGGVNFRLRSLLGTYTNY